MHMEGRQSRVIQDITTLSLLPFILGIHNPSYPDRSLCGNNDWRCTEIWTRGATITLTMPSKALFRYASIQDWLPPLRLSEFPYQKQLPNGNLRLRHLLKIYSSGGTPPPPTYAPDWTITSGLSPVLNHQKKKKKKKGTSRKVYRPQSNRI